jgi:hypothetical protein
MLIVGDSPAVAANMDAFIQVKPRRTLSVPRTLLLLSSSLSLSLSLSVLFLISFFLWFLDSLPPFATPARGSVSLQGMFSLGGDTEASVRKHVCQAIVLLMDVCLDRIQSYLPQLIDVCVCLCSFFEFV